MFLQSHFLQSEREDCRRRVNINESDGLHHLETSSVPYTKLHSLSE